MPIVVQTVCALAASLALAVLPRAPAPDGSDAPSRASAGRAPAVAPEAGGAPAAQSIGTIEATLDGEARTWYVVSGEADGRRQPGAFWMEVAPGERVAVVGGFDTEDFDFSDVEFQGGMPVSLGSYEGSMLSISFPLGEGQGEGSWTLPGGDATVTYVADAGAMDFSGMLVLDEGVVEITRARTEGPCRFEGRFSGTLRPMGGEGDGVEVREGTFRVEECEELTAPG